MTTVGTPTSRFVGRRFVEGIIENMIFILCKKREILIEGMLYIDEEIEYCV